MIRLPLISMITMVKFQVIGTNTKATSATKTKTIMATAKIIIITIKLLRK